MEPRLHAFPPFSIAWAVDPYKGGDRPFVIVSDGVANDLYQRAATLIISSQKRGQVGFPGWVPVYANPPLTKPSFITAAIVTKPRSEISSVHPGVLSDSIVGDVRAMMYAILSDLSPRDRDYWHTFLKQLPPTSIRYGENGNLRVVCKTLARNGWLAPAQGAILKCPPWHKEFGGQHWLVVSNTEFNTRYHFPKVVVVPLKPVGATGHSASTWKAHGWETLDGGTGLPGGFFVHHENPRTFDASQDWLRRCRRCYSSSGFPYCGFVAEGTATGSCVFCDDAPAQWPARVGAVDDRVQMASILARVHRYLAVMSP